MSSSPAKNSITSALFCGCEDLRILVVLKEVAAKVEGASVHKKTAPNTHIESLTDFRKREEIDLDCISRTLIEKTVTAPCQKNLFSEKRVFRNEWV